MPIKKRVDFEFDENDPVEKELIGMTRFTKNDYKRLLLLGFTMFQNSTSEMFKETFEKRIESAVFEKVVEKENELKERVDSLLKENVALVKNFDHQIDKVKKDIEQKYTTEISSLNWKVKTMEDMKTEYVEKCAELEEKLQFVHKEMYLESVRHLKSILNEKDMEIKLLKGATNAPRVHMVGDGMIAHLLRDIYNDAEVYEAEDNKSITYVTLKDGKSKFMILHVDKQVITSQDIDEFYKALAKSGTQIIGGLFVSLHSKNIPGKGSVTLEKIGYTEEGGHLPYSQPALFLGYEDDADFFNFFRQELYMFVELCKFMYEMQQYNGGQDIHYIMTEVEFFYKNLLRSKKRLENIKTHFNDYVAETEKDTSQHIQRLETVMAHFSNRTAQVTNAPIAVTATATPTQKGTKRGGTPDKYKCEQCDSGFPLKKLLTQHKKACTS